MNADNANEDVVAYELLVSAVSAPRTAQGSSLSKLLETAIAECIDDNGLDSWLSLSRDAARFFVKLYFQGVAYCLSRHFSLDDRCAPLALGFAMANQPFFFSQEEGSSDSFLSVLQEAYELPRYSDSERSVPAAIQRLGWRTARVWIDQGLENSFPTETNQFLMQIYDENAIADATNLEGVSAYNNLMIKLDSQDKNSEETWKKNPTFEETRNELHKLIASQPERTEPETDHEKLERHIGLLVGELEDLQFAPRKISEEEVKFTYNGRPFLARLSATDLEFYEVVALNVFRIESANQLSKLYHTVNIINRETKLAKLIIGPKETGVAGYSQAFYTSIWGFFGNLRTLCMVTDVAANKLRAAMKPCRESESDSWPDIPF